jgi:hypothetical protein
MANEFIARKGIIVLENGAKITGSANVIGDVSASGDVIGVNFRGSGQFLTDIAADSVQFENVLNKPTLVSASSQISYTGLSNIPAGIVSSSGQVTSLLPAGTVSSSGQINGANITNNSVSYTAGAGLSGGGAATLGGSAVTLDVVAGAGISLTGPTNDAVNVDTGSGHFVSGSRKSISSANTTGASGINLTYNNATGIISGSLVNSSVTVNGQAISLGGSGTVTANTTNALTLGSGLTGTSFNGSTAVTATVDTGSTHFLDGVKKELNTEGVISSSAQVAINSTTGTLNVNKGGTGQTSYVNGELLIGNTTGNTLTKATLTQGNGMTITNGAGSITLAVDTGSAHFQNGVLTRINSAGVYSSSAQVSYTGLSNIPAGIVSNSTQVASLLPAGTVSASSQVVASQITGIGAYAVTASNTFTGIQTIGNTTQSTNFTNGALVVSGGVGIAKNLNVSGNVNISGLLTVVSMSTQYVTSSQYTIGTSRIILNDDDNVRFAGLSINDSGSTAATGSLLWDSLRDRFIYDTNETTGGGVAHSAVLITGPESYGGLGNETELVIGRIPVATTDHNLDNRIASSSIRIDFPTKLTHVEAGLQVTGSVSSSVGFSGNGAGLTNVIASGVAANSVALGTDTTGNYAASVGASNTGIVVGGTAGEGTAFTVGLATASATFTSGVVSALPAGTVSSSGQVTSLLPAGTVSASSQVAINSTTGTLDVNKGGTGATTHTSGNILLGNGANAVQSIARANLTGDGKVIVTNGTGVLVGTAASLAIGGGIVSSSGQITYSGLSGIPAGIVSSSTQFTSLSAPFTGSFTGSFTGDGSGLTGIASTLQAITNGGSSTTNQVQLNGGATIHGVLFTSASATGIAGPVTNQVVATFATASYDSAHFDYVVKSGTNLRTGTVMTVWQAGTANIEFTDTSTNDLGNTLGVIFTPDLNGGNVRLKVTTPAGTWAVKTAVRML